MKILKNELKNLLDLRTQKDYPIKGVEFIDITPMLIKREIFQEIINKLTQDVKKTNAQYIVVPEARGFLIGSAVAYNLNIGCIPVRKKGKLPPIAIECEFEYEKEYGKDILVLPKLVNEQYENKDFYIIDDIYATGNTIKSIKQAIENEKGNIVGTGVIINIVELNNDNVYSLIDVNED